MRLNKTTKINHKVSAEANPYVGPNIDYGKTPDMSPEISWEMSQKCNNLKSKHIDADVNSEIRLYTNPNMGSGPLTLAQIWTLTQAKTWTLIWAYGPWVWHPSNISSCINPNTSPGTNSNMIPDRSSSEHYKSKHDSWHELWHKLWDKYWQESKGNYWP